MLARIAVVHSGSPAQVGDAARRIAEVLARAGVRVEVRSARELESLHEFDSAVICGQIGHSGWRDEAVDFIARHRRTLAHLSVAYCLGLSPELDVGDARALQRSVKHVLDWYNEIRPIRVGFFHLGRASAPAEVERWAERLKPNFIAPDLDSPAGLREFLAQHPAESSDTSALPVSGYSAPERRLARGDLRAANPARDLQER